MIQSYQTAAERATPIPEKALYGKGIHPGESFRR